MAQLKCKSSGSVRSSDASRATCQVGQIVVIGHQRSGTSAIASLLSAAAAVRLVDDPPWTYTPNVRQVYGDGAATTTYLEEHRTDFEFGILKAPALTPLAPFIERWKPSLRFVVVVRNPRDTVAASLEWRRHRDDDSDFNFWDLGWLGIEETDRLRALAWRWRRYMEMAEQLKRATWVSYDCFCCDKEGTVRRLVAALGLEECACVASLTERQFKKNFGDRRIRGLDRWRSEFSVEQVEQIDALCDSTWRRVEQRLI
jgi:hypothetical protein